MQQQPVIFSVNGPVVKVRNQNIFSMMEMVYVGSRRLIGEVIGLTDTETTIQVYESTSGLRTGEPVEPTGAPMSVTLGPGIMTNIFDGIERPLRALESASGAFIGDGLDVPILDTEKQYDVTVKARVGTMLQGGEVYASCPETSVILHLCMIPPNLSGKVVYAAPDGKYCINDEILRLEDAAGRVHSLTLCQKWPIRRARPAARRLAPSRPMITGQRVLDTLFPIARGGTAAIPGGFGTGKTMTQHQIAKWCDADIIVYIGCGERGNEMTQVLEEFTALKDPRTGKSLMERTVLIANTSNMPVAAREASIYTGITLAEYYRDMGYHIAIMADSTSRWAEALREISGRLEEMPAEEGYPAYLPSRLSEFYERTGAYEVLSGREGSVTVIGAVSPQGSDFSEPVTQNTKRFVRCFWGLDKALAYARHYPAINWTMSYSEYMDDLAQYYEREVDRRFIPDRTEISGLLKEEQTLMDIVRLIGSDVLPDDQKLVIEIARVIRVGFLQQNAYHAEDTYVPLKKQFRMMELILHVYHRAKDLIAERVPLDAITGSGIFEQIIKVKYDIPNRELQKFDTLTRSIDRKLDALRAQRKEAAL
ncbi:MAG: V-type ATP synthase subunit A [Oscillospiraceae bacterium]|nr:V-type ATP synthase subunit A [Oscillospiraceae bacterium]